MMSRRERVGAEAGLAGWTKSFAHELEMHRSGHPYASVEVLVICARRAGSYANQLLDDTYRCGAEWPKTDSPELW